MSTGPALRWDLRWLALVSIARSSNAAAVTERAARRLSRAVGRGAKLGAAIVLFLLIGELTPRIGMVDRIFLPPFSEVVLTWFDMAAGGQLWEDVGASLARALAGFLIADAIAVPLGIVIGWYRSASELLNPLLEIFRNTAALALLPVFVLLLGLGETSKVSLIIFACTWPVLLDTISAVRTVDPLLVKSARSLGF